MTSISRFDSSVQCEEVFTLSPAEIAELLAAPDDEWITYHQTRLAPSTLYIDPKDGKVKQIPEPKSLGRINGIEL